VDCHLQVKEIPLSLPSIGQSLPHLPMCILTRFCFHGLRLLIWNSV